MGAISEIGMNRRLSELKVFVHSQKDRMERLASFFKNQFATKTKKLIQSVVSNARHFHIGKEDVPWIRQGLFVSAFLLFGVGAIVGLWYFNPGLEFVIAGGLVFLPWALLAPQPRQVVKTETENEMESIDTTEIGRVRGKMEYEVIPLDFGVKAEGQIWHDPQGKFPDSVIIKAPGIYIQISDPDPKRSDKDIEITVKGENKVLVTTQGDLLIDRLVIPE